MRFTETLIFYALIGGGVAVAMFAADDRRRFGERAFRTATALLFWPLYLPILLSTHRPSTISASTTTKPQDEVTRMLHQVESELDAALASLDGWAEGVLAREQGQIDELKRAWAAQSARIHDLDRVLAQPEFTHAAESARPELSNERLQHSESARQQNILRLREVRRQAYDDLMSTLACVRELVTMIHLAKFTGAPASKAEELVARIAAAVEGIAEASEWQSEQMNQQSESGGRGAF
ncbi:MAG: hypothetical protein HZA46_04690 [Planctomycetales bacterium]|nr:hypothetical protein [Planctomycetales bacterium]